MAKLSSDGKYVTVESGDTLSEIARDYGNGASYQELAKLNNIKDPDYIRIGQKIYLKEQQSEKKNVSQTAKITSIGVVSDDLTQLYAEWTWDREDTDHYLVRWWVKYENMSKGVRYNPDEDEKVKAKYCLFTPPSGVTRATLYVKPIAKTEKVGGKDVAKWTVDWSTAYAYDIEDNPPPVPPTPTVKIEGLKLTASLEGLDLNADYIYFKVLKEGERYSIKKAPIKGNAASYTFDIEAGGTYSVCALSYRSSDYAQSDWSQPSSITDSQPIAPSDITVCRADSATSVYLKWDKSPNTNSYEIQHATESRHLDVSNAFTSITVEGFNEYYITGLESGDEYFFRVRAVLGEQKSEWTEIKSVIIGKKPAAPTTWSSTTTAKVGEDITMYWVHNAEDNSKQSWAQLELTVNGVTETIEIENTAVEEEDENKTSFRIFSRDELTRLFGSAYSVGCTINWRVRTSGILKDEDGNFLFGDWSVKRIITVHAPPTLWLKVLDEDDHDVSTLTSYPLMLIAEAGPPTQTPLSYHITICANEAYETVDNVGNPKWVNIGEEVYSKHFSESSDRLVVELSAGHVSLANNVSYTVKGLVSMDSGLTAEESYEFTVGWAGEGHMPMAEIILDESDLTTSIRAYCEDENGELIDGVLLSIYRREYDGSFVEIAKNLSSTDNAFVTDPHPALDYARYRVVAMDETTGIINYHDVPGYPVGEASVIIQWDEQWSGFEAEEPNPNSEITWTGSMLKLPYNIDVADNTKPDVALVEYIGRKHPVAYYGTQVGATATWNVEIDATDKETLYGIRRLAHWMGDVYVREPSGSGYWANITVSFNQKHTALTIPVTFNITRVAGGV